MIESAAAIYFPHTTSQNDMFLDEKEKKEEYRPLKLSINCFSDAAFPEIGSELASVFMLSDSIFENVVQINVVPSKKKTSSLNNVARIVDLKRVNKSARDNAQRPTSWSVDKVVMAFSHQRFVWTCGRLLALAYIHT